MDSQSKLLESFSQHPVQQTAELAALLNLSNTSVFRLLTKLQNEGQIIKVGRGVYQRAEHYQQQDPWLAALRVYPNGVLCLLSALAFHQLTTQSPSVVWVALASNTWRKQQDYPPIQVIHMRGTALTEGVELHSREGGDVRVFSVAKTIADCFKFRNRIGLDVAIEALCEGWANQHFNLTELDAMAKVCRVHNVMRPYVESLIS